MTRLYLLRHGRTQWNSEGRIQGRTETDLSAEGETQVREWRLPSEATDAPCFSSPLRRARQTAAILGWPDAPTDRRLAEMRWGEFEGRTLAELRAEHGPAMAELEALGLDFRPPGGESPRLVADRLGHFLNDTAPEAPEVLVVVAHKGILRAAVVLACDWTMQGKPPVPIEDDHALLFDLDRMGNLSWIEAVRLR